MCAVGLGHDHQPGGVLVEPVHDAGPLDAADARQRVAAMGDQRVHQRAGRIAGSGMDHEPARLVDHDDLVVLKHDVERDAFGLRYGRFGRRNCDRDRLAGVDAVPGIADCAAPDRDLTGEDQRFEPRAREAVNAGGEHAVEPRARVRCGDHDVSIDDQQP